MEVSVYAVSAHVKLCERLPLPDELRQEMLETGASTKALAIKYGCGFSSMKSRLNGSFSGDGAAAYRSVKKVSYCLRCGIRLDHPEVPAAGALCAWCAIRHEQPSPNWAMGIVLA
jgi:hypothetical protein